MERTEKKQGRSLGLETTSGHGTSSCRYPTYFQEGFWHPKWKKCQKNAQKGTAADRGKEGHVDKAVESRTFLR